MEQVRTLRSAIAAAGLATTLLFTGCAATQQAASPDSAPNSDSINSAIVPPATPAGFQRPASGGANSGGVNSGGSSVAAPSVPATWPRDVPVPPGKLLGSTTLSGRWTLLLLEAGSAAQVLKSAGAFYKAAGYTAVTASVLNKGSRHITLVVENRDHSATKTFLAIQLTTP
jgi:hypothetical protein